MREGVPDYSWQADWLGGRNPHEATEFALTALGEEGPLPKLSYLRIVLPFDPNASQFAKFAEICLRLCEILRPYHGYGGLGFAVSADMAVEDQAQPLVYAMARRFPGIEVDKPWWHGAFLSEGIKGVNWLTVLGGRWLEAMGGPERLRESLSEAFVFHPLERGLVIQAGPRPQAGDMNQRIWPSFYAELARLLKPIRVKDLGSFGSAGENRFTRETTTEWLNRFDKDPSFLAT
jgi:hypothetical protein